MFWILRDGILLVNKPYGITSFDVVYKIRKILKIKKVGHCGTLDPIATGVLPIFFGKATKAIYFIQNTDKEYISKFKFGLKTDTKDITGKILKEERPFVLKKELEDVLESFIGEISQKPPMYSAVKVSGVPLYKLARQGKVVERENRNIKIYSLKCLEFDEQKQEGILKIFCSSGTYIRTLIEDIAFKLNTFGVVLELKRTIACGFLLKDCVNLDYVEMAEKKEKLEQYVISIESLFKDFEKIQLSLKDQKRFLNGVRIELKLSRKNGEMFSVYGEKFLGIAENENGFLKIVRVFNV